MMFNIAFFFLEEQKGEFLYKINELDGVKAVFDHELYLRSEMKHFLALLLFKTVFKKHDYRPLGAVNFFVFTHSDHCVGVHGFTSEKLKIFKFAHKVLHDIIDVCLEFINFRCAIIFLQIFENFLHIGLQISGKSFLITETSFNKLVVKDDVNTGNGTLVGTFIITGLFRSISSCKDNFSLFASFILSNNFVHNIVLQSDFVGVGEQFVTGENILVDQHVEFAKNLLKFRLKLALSRERQTGKSQF